MNIIRPYLHRGRWAFQDGKRIRHLSPPAIVESALPPTISGLDKVILLGAKLKCINNPEGGFDVKFSETKFFDADFMLNNAEAAYGGTQYQITSLNEDLKVPTGMKAWFCNTLSTFYPEKPKVLYVAIVESE